MSTQQTPAAIGRVEYVTIDCRDPQRLAEFWSDLLGVTIARAWGPYVILNPLPNSLALSFQRVSEPKRSKNRLHLDIRVQDVEAASGRVEALGGRAVSDVEDQGHGWRVVEDPEGNEFCLLRPR